MSHNERIARIQSGFSSFALAKRETSCAAQLDASAAGGFATGGRTTQKRRTQATGRSKFSSPGSRHNPFAYAWFDGWLGLPVGWRKAEIESWAQVAGSWRSPTL